MPDTTILAFSIISTYKDGTTNKGRTVMAERQTYSFFHFHAFLRIAIERFRVQFEGIGELCIEGSYIIRLTRHQVRE